MYRIYNVETEKLVKTLHVLHSRQSSYESLFAGKTSAAYEFYLQINGKWGIQHYAINLTLYLRTIKDKYIEIYSEFISQLHMYAILAKGYLLISLITPSKLQEILNSIKEMLIKN